ncbi:uncharacterized protein fam49a isoform X1 [Scophthalmus maximus]|uniref:uncharacterized protein fam49a isoform X1 n=1 Tax=Scophthalmus maximus TaxID=52904 RepID=UPI001FA8F3D3|nr:uncharacterized protein fam49a isoform X1 [Scophthalmus maximus]XP_035472580.2 uncharacterized protein fam49a isoform X1 [Scophthalmus maximus]
MDKTTHEDISVQTGRALTSPPSPKRPRTDCTVTDNNSAETRFDFPDLWTFRKTVGSAASLHKNVVLICSVESGDGRDEKLHEQPQHTKLIVTPITKATASHTDDAHAGLSEVCLITAERHLLHLGKDEQPPLTKTDKLSSYPRDDAGGALAESDTSKDTSADTSSHPDCRRLGKSLEHEHPGGCCLPAGNDIDGRQVQNNVIQIQAFNLSSRAEVVRCQSDCTHEDALCNAGFRNARSESAEVKACNQKKNKLVFGENIMFIKEEANSHTSLSDCADSKSVYSNPEEQPSGNFAHAVKTEEKISENVAACERETKGHVNETGMRKSLIHSVAECAQGSIVAYDMVLARNITAEKVSFEVDDFCVVKGKRAAGEMIARARSDAADHTTETPMPARISREPTEGDNDPGAFSVIDPAIWSEADMEAEVKRCNSESTAAVERSPSVKVCGTDTQEVSAHDQTGQRNHQSTPRKPEEKEDLTQSYTEPQAVSIPINQTHNTSGNESWKSSPSSSPHRHTKPPPAVDGRHESHRSVRHQVKELIPVILDDLVEYSQTGFARMDRAPEVKEREDMLSCVGQIKTDEYWNSEKSMESWEELLQQNRKDKINTKKISAGDCISDPTEGEVGEYDNRSTLVEDEETAEDGERKEVIDVGEGNKTEVQGKSEILVRTADKLQQGNKHKRDMTEVSHVECVSERTEGVVSKSENTLSQVSQHEHGNKLSCFPAETLMVENKDDLAFFPLAPTSDAVVPCKHDLNHSRNAHSNPTALNCNDRFSPVPSVFTFYDRAPRGFDTFEKIQLSPDDDGDDGDAAAGLGNSPLLTSSPGQLLETSQRQLSRSMPATGEIPGEEGGGKEEVQRIQRCIDYKKVLSSDSTCNELLNLISEADIVDIADVIALGCSEQLFGCDLACASAVHIQDEFNPQSKSSTVSTESDSPSDANMCPEFQMKEHFDMVLKELNLFFEISINDFASDSKAPTPEQCSDTAEASEGDVSNCKEHLSSPQLGGHRDTSSDDADEDSTLEMSEGDPGVSCTSGSRDGEQEVPLCSQETSVCAAEKHREPWGMEQRSEMWSPSFMSPPFLEQLSYRPPEKHKRLEPLRTCTRPIQVGLSKRAKTKHLHRPHPYK